MWQRSIITIFFFISIWSSRGQSFLGTFSVAFKQLNTTANAFYKIKTPKRLTIPGGGHVQGVQVNGNTLYLTGSSSGFGYCVLCNINSKHGGMVTTIDTLAQNPYRHAGGFQICNGLLAVGVEDNHAKNKSVVVLWPVGSNGPPQYIAYRAGSYKRSTAGATGIAQLSGGRLLIVVGDWDSRNLDFYLSRTGSNTLFDSLTTYHVPQGIKWGSYQSVNLVTDTTGALYMLGFCRDDKGNRADLFQLSLQGTAVTVSPVLSRYFKCPRGTGFRYGAGISFMPNGRPVICATRRRLTAGFTVAFFR